jgi:hypothetical protein
MKRFLVLAVVGALSLTGGTGLALGEPTHPHTPAKPEAKKTQPPASPGKHPPSKSQPQAKKSTTTAKPTAHKDPKQAQKQPAKPGKGSKPDKGSYTWDDYKKDLDKGIKEQQDGFKKELPADLKILGGAVSGIPKGKDGIVAGAAGAAIANAPDLVQGKYLEGKGLWDELAATDKFIWSGLNNTSKSNPRPKNGRLTGK